MNNYKSRNYTGVRTGGFPCNSLHKGAYIASLIKVYEVLIDVP